MLPSFKDIQYATENKIKVRLKIKVEVVQKGKR